MVPFHTCRTSDISGRGYVAASRMIDRAAAVVITVGRVDAPAIEGAVLPGVDHVIGGVLGSPLSGTFGQDHAADE